MAIIAVLVAIAIPMFTAQLEKAREATDQANIRSAYAMVSAAALSPGKSTDAAPDGGDKITYTRNSDGTLNATVSTTQSDPSKWETGDTVNIGGQDVGPGSRWNITYADGVVTIAPATGA